MPEELRVLYVSQAKLLQSIQHLQKDLQSDFSGETFQSVSWKQRAWSMRTQPKAPAIPPLSGIFFRLLRSPIDLTGALPLENISAAG